MVSPVGESADRCGSCGNDLRAKARFCDVCGTPVVRRPAGGEHKQVTVLFTDVVGSMKLAAVLDAERLREIMNELFNRAAAVVQRYQGTVDKFTGDGLMALFGAPVALEDHALRACISALEIQSVTTALAAEVLRRDGVNLRVRIGLNSGDVVTGEIGSGPGRYTAVGHTVGMAQRMESAAAPGGVLCSQSTAVLVEDAALLGPVVRVEVKGADAPVPARELLAVETEQMVLGRNEGTMLGRDSYLDQLQRTFESRSDCLVGIVGEPGLGKSRLVSEFAAIAARREADVFVARCEAHTSRLAFRALSRLLHDMFKVDGLDPADARDRVVAQCGLTAGSPDSRILFEVMGIDDCGAHDPQLGIEDRRSRVVEVMRQAVLARPNRTVFILEDAHWIDTPSDEVLADFAVALDGASTFLTTYRPEFAGALHRSAERIIRLAPLDEEVAARLVCQVLGGDASLGGLAERIAAAADGNPYFIEEIVRDLAGRGVLAGCRGGYRMAGDFDRIAVPATVQAVLAARIDRLPVETKSILNAAAVIGFNFDMDILQVLQPKAEPACLTQLVSAELIDQTEFLPRQRYCFHHPLVRAVAYESQLGVQRARAHGRLAAEIQHRNPDAADENAALIATHLEAAGEHAEAHRWHMRAAKWLRPRDLCAAREQWESARQIADTLPDQSEDVIGMRIAPRTMLMSTSLYVGNNAHIGDQYREFRALTMRTDDTRSLAIGTAGQLWTLMVNDSLVSQAAALATELHDMVSPGWDANTAGIVLNAIAFARFANCEFDTALGVLDELLNWPEDVPTVEVGPAVTLRGVIEMCVGNSEQGRHSMAQGIAMARELPSAAYSHVMMYGGLVASLGLTRGDEFLDDIREARRRAESVADVSGTLCARWAYGTVLLRARPESREEAIGQLERAQTDSRKHNLAVFLRAFMVADLAAASVKNGNYDQASSDLRGSFDLHLSTGSRVFAGAAGEALVELLVARGSGEDLAEARRVVDAWQARRPGIAALDLWWLRARAWLARAGDDADEYADLATSYLTLCEKLDAVGRLDDARLMAAAIRKV